MRHDLRANSGRCGADRRIVGRIANPSSSTVGRIANPSSSMAEILPSWQAVARRGFTLVEVILAMALAVVVLGLVGFGIQIHTQVATKSRDQVEEAQLARVILQRIADDLRNATPLQIASTASSSLSGSSSSSGSSSGSTVANSTSGGITSNAVYSSADSDSTDTNATPPLASGGIYGTDSVIQIETVHRPRTLVSLGTISANSNQTDLPSDIRVVTYGLGARSMSTYRKNRLP